MNTESQVTGEMSWQDISILFSKIASAALQWNSSKGYQQ